jgi:isoleucyl-tRNA synthetase
MPKPNFRQQPNLPELEVIIEKWWQAENAFQKSVEMRSPDKSYVFYDGPPFATGMPHYGHLLASTTKDVIPRYWTMKGYRVERVWGWDCHGLPIENMIEKQLEIKDGKRGIEKLGIDKFNAACRAEVLRLDKEWEKIVSRLGRWVDMEHNYKTMDTSFMESVWWGFKQLHEKGLIYEGRKVVLYCPRCATPLSNFEIAMDNSYQDVTDESVFVKFAIVDKPGESLIAWTTTPWTLPGNVGLAVHPTSEYVRVKVSENESVWVAGQRAGAVFGENFEILETKMGNELVGWQYQPLYTYLPVGELPAYRVWAAEFVTMDDGTGVVHTAAMYGEDDYALAQQNNLPRIPMLDEEGKFLPFVELVAGKFYRSTHKTIIEDLQNRNLLLKEEAVTHSYPFCYRCGTPLYYNAVPAWFIDVKQIKNRLIEHNESLNWYPNHLKHGRFQKGLEGAPDWNISRSRYWGTPMPIWRATDATGATQLKIIGSLAELKEWAVDPRQVAGLTDIHREFLDDIEVWVDAERTLKGTRIPEVFDCWVESGSMPFASTHYPFENENHFLNNYPAQFVSEYIAQTRAWFYTMHVLSVGIFDKPAFENALTTGTILAEDGTKMSKSKKNYPDPVLLIDKYGADSLRLYLMSSTVMKGENLNFNEKDVSDIRRKVFVIWWNLLSFYESFADTSAPISQPQTVPAHIMDQWLLAKVNALISETTTLMDNYDVVRSSRLLMEFVNELSTWYLRLSRDRLRGSDNQETSQVFGYALYTLAQLFAPFAPFFSELVHHSLVNEATSIHHQDWPNASEKLSNAELLQEMVLIQQVVELGHGHRKEAGVKVRQPLAELKVTAAADLKNASLLEVVKQELNVKMVSWQVSAGELSARFDLTLTDELKAEGLARELARSIQNMRKEAGLSPADQVRVQLPEWPAEWEEWLKTKTNTSQLVKGESAQLITN